jgi:hypothetical protein
MIDPTGLSDATAGLAEQLRKSNVTIPAGHVYRVSALNVPRGRTIAGPGTLLIADRAERGVRLDSGATLTGVSVRGGPGFAGSGVAIELTERGAGCRVEACDIALEGAGLHCIYAERGGTDHVVRGNTIVARAASYGVLQISGRRALVEGNTVKGPNSGLYAFHLADSLIRDNTTRGGIVGIGILMRRDLAPSLTTGNVILGNTVLDAREESISLDCTGDQPNGWAENPNCPIATVRRASSPNVRQHAIDIAEPVPYGWAERDWYVIVLSGAAAGQVAAVEGSPRQGLVVSRAGGDFADLLKPGDKLLISRPFLGNRIVGNTVAPGPTGWGIRLYGSAWHNVVTGNTVTAITPCISVSSIVGPLGVPGRFGAQCWSGFNRVVENTVIQPKGAGSAKWAPIFDEIYGDGRWQDTPHVPAAYRHHRNVYRGNVIESGRGILIQGTSATVDGNRLAGGAGIELLGAIDARIGRNVNAAGPVRPKDLGGSMGTGPLPPF